jgi:hypothetical protein
MQLAFHSVPNLEVQQAPSSVRPNNENLGGEQVDDSLLLYKPIFSASPANELVSD